MTKNKQKNCTECLSEYCTDPYLDNGRKIKDEIENPFSTTLLKINDPLLKPMARQGISANMLTFFSLLAGLAAIYFVWKYQPILGGIFYGISYFFDCSDGCMARYTHTESEFGDKFDHYKDILIFVSLILVVQIRYPPTKKWWTLFVTLFLLSLVHFGSVERFNRICCGKNQPNNVLNICSIFSETICPEKQTDSKQTTCKKLESSMKWTRWGGDGSLVFAIIIYLVTRPTSNRKEEGEETDE